MLMHVGPFEPVERWKRLSKRKLAASFEARVAIEWEDSDRLDFSTILERNKSNEMIDWLYANVGTEFDTWAIDHAMVLVRYLYFARQSDAVWFMVRFAGPD